MEMNSTTPGVRLCHKLTKYHVWLSPYAKMKVNLAAQVSLWFGFACRSMHMHQLCMQVLSETVASVLQILNKDNTVETRLFIRNMDRFFDCLNVKSPRQGILERKEYRRPYSSPTDHRFKVLFESLTIHPHSCVLAHMHTHTHSHTHTCTHTTCTHIDMHTHTCIYTQTHTCTCTHTTCTCTHTTCTHTHTCIYTQTQHACTHTQKHIHTHVHTPHVHP